MPGRLEEYDNFVNTARNVSEGNKKPRVKGQIEEKKRRLDKSNADAAIKESEDHSFICIISFKSIKRGRRRFIYAVIPKKRIKKTKNRLYIEIIDIKDLCRKTIRRDTVSSIKLTEKKFPGNQNAIGYR